MIVICAWCERILVDNHDGGRVISHGICETCKAEMIAGLDKITQNAKKEEGKQP